jgi:hypothetical protein
MTKKQCGFHIESVVGDGFAPVLEIFERVRTRCCNGSSHGI